MKLLLILFTITGFASSIKDYPFYEYKALFTNPICKEYRYNQQVYSNSGKLLISKPKNVYCKKSDFFFNNNRVNTPHFELKNLIADSDLSSLFLTYLSFSNQEVALALCDAAKRGVAITFIIDSKNRERKSGRKWLDYLSKCEDILGNKPRVEFRGNVKGLGYAHNKIIMASYKSTSKKTKIVFSSGNMSSGTVLHHENWSFLTTSKDTYFYQAHLCIKEGMLTSISKKQFKAFMKLCRSKIKTKEEDDIKLYVVPSDGRVAMNNIVSAFDRAVSIEAAAHRFTHPDLVMAMQKAAGQLKKVRFVVDDDIYWAGKRKKTTGSNMVSEFYKVMSVLRSGVEVRYVQSNQNSRLLHHNKYLIFNFADGTGAVHTGAGNFTKAAFTKNYENYYYITIPEVVTKFKDQFEYKFNWLATTYEMMPSEYINP
ncbi:MAG: phospholipase D-like domain-containing protein [Bacteriovoracaceae bacterium]|nr:phospholipase D-like domain-containing protein [Bacteriovoracaceae bacterium]